jgi:hypothetical protein
VSGPGHCLELDRCQSPEAVLSASAVVGLLDPDHDGQAQFLSGGPAADRFRTFFCSRLKNDSMAALRGRPRRGPSTRAARPRAVSERRRGNEIDRAQSIVATAACAKDISRTTRRERAGWRGTRPRRSQSNRVTKSDLLGSRRELGPLQQTGCTPCPPPAVVGPAAQASLQRIGPSVGYAPAAAVLGLVGRAHQVGRSAA